MNDTIQKLEDSKSRLKEYIRIFEENGDWDKVVEAKDLLRSTNNLLMRAKKLRKKQLFNADFHNVDEFTEKAVSLKPLTREILMANYRICDSFNTVTLNSINEDLPVRLSNKALSKLVKEVFPTVESRRITGDIKYNLEMII